MDKKPAVEPVLKPDLQVEHSALVAPGFVLVDPAPVAFRNPQFRETKGVLGKAAIVEAHAITATRAKVWKDLPVDEFHERLLRGRIRRNGGLRSWFGGGGLRTG